MANESRARQGRAPATSQNSATLGIILVVFAVFIAVLLFNAGGGNSADDGGVRTAAEAANGSSKSTTTSTSTPPPTTPPAELKVLVGNGSGVTGRAKDTAAKLTTLGYSNLTAVDGKQAPTTIVYFAPNHDTDAAAIAAQMNLTPDRVQPLSADSPLKVPVGDAAVVVLVGTDFDPATAVFGTTTAPTN